MYGMRYGVLITLIAALKMAVKQKRFNAFFHHMGGFFEAKKRKRPFHGKPRRRRFYQAFKMEKYEI